MKRIIGLVSVVLVGFACSEAAVKPEPAPAVAPPPTAEVLPTSTTNTYSLKHTDGTYDLYIGPGVKEAMESGQSLPPSWFKLGKVKQSRVDKALQKGKKVATFSLEDLDASDMDIEFSEREGKSMKLKAGDPCVSGVVQVVIDTTGSPTALFDVSHWVKYPNGPTVKNMYSTGVVPDDEWPTLRFVETPPPDCQ